MICAAAVTVHEDAEAARGYAERPRGPGKRPTVKWSKLGSDAESPPGKRTKVQVPGVKAANGRCSACVVVQHDFTAKGV